jgi:glycosyltransferase involved in cell wall biosynthesis
MTKKILYVVGTYPSPTETFIEREITGLRELGLAITVWPIFPGGESSAGRPLLSGASPSLTKAKRQVLRSTGLGELSISLKGRLHAKKLLAHIKGIDHIHAHFLGLPATVAYHVWRQTGIPYSLTGHARDIYVEQTPTEVIRNAAFRTTCTQHNVDYLNEKYPDSPFILVRHGIDVSQYSFRREQSTTPPCRLLAIGRLVEKKGFIYLIRACSVLKDWQFPFHLTLIGDGPLRSVVETEISHLEPGMAIMRSSLLPHSEIIQSLHLADLLVVPSVLAQDGDLEGIPNVILEGMAVGVPVIATPAGSIREAVKNGITGVTVEEKNPYKLAMMIQHLWIATEKRSHLARQARHHCTLQSDQFAWLQEMYRLFKGSLRTLGRCACSHQPHP